MRGPGGEQYEHEDQWAAEVAAVIASLEEAGIEIKLGHIIDEHRPRLTVSQAKPLKRHRLDIVRVLLARQMVAEAEAIRKKWSYPDNRTMVNGLRYGDLLFSARAVLPPRYDWGLVGYHDHTGLVDWSHQLTWDKNRKTIEGVAYDIDEATQLIDDHKGDGRHLPEDLE